MDDDEDAYDYSDYSGDGIAIDLEDDFDNEETVELDHELESDLDS